MPDIFVDEVIVPKDYHGPVDRAYFTYSGNRYIKVGPSIGLDKTFEEELWDDEKFWNDFNVWGS
jgi:hypothetical protein